MTKEQLNNRGYNKFLKLTGEVAVEIDEAKIIQAARWDGLKGYITNTNLPPAEIIENYGQLWRIERAFRISKTDLRIRPMYHRRRRRIEAHILVAFVAYTIYKELEGCRTNSLMMGGSCGLTLAIAVCVEDVALDKTAESHNVLGSVA